MWCSGVMILYKVLIDNKDSCVVDLAAKHYDYRNWQVLSLPYIYAIKCINNIKSKVDNYMHYYLLKDAHMTTHEPQITHIPTNIRWPWVLSNELQPPKVKNPIERPKKSKKRETVQ